ncbi:hypothetical protein ACF0H5_001607 [Mactra antiquata]
MASSDEEDLEALRLAALATLKQKQEAQQPQGIQVLSSISSTSNQYQDGGGMHPDNYASGGMHPDGYAGGGMHPESYASGGMHPDNYVYQDYGEVPYAFQQAVFKQQMRGRGRGFQRGRGRGRGNRFQPKPVPQSALIVIQVEGKEDEQPKIEEKPKDSRPFLLRPQDKWASTEGSSQDSTPTRPKDTSKFSRYDDETDSEEDEYVDKSADMDTEPSHLRMNISLDDVSSDTEIDINKNNHGSPEVEVHNDHQDDVIVHDDSDNEMEAINTDSKVNDETSATNTEITRENQVLTNPGVQYLPNQAVENPAASRRSTIVNETDNGATDGITELRQGNALGDVRNVVKNKNITVLGDTAVESSDSTPLRDEGTPVQDELRQDDSVSNSYVTFSRFNRRNRRDSNSGSEEEEDDDDDDNDDAADDDILKSDSQSDKDSISSVSDFVLEDNDDSDKEDESSMKEITSHVSPDTKSTAKTIEHSQDVKSSITASVNARKSSKSMSSASSAASSSSSESSSPESDSDASSSSSSNDKKKLTSKNQSLKSSTSSNSENIKNKDDLAHSRNSAKHNSYHKDNKVNIDRKEVSADSSHRNERKGRRNSEEVIDNRTNRSDRSHKYNDKKSHRDKYTTNHVKADPEFDATNYRDETLFNKNDRRSESYDRGKRDNRDNRQSPESSKHSVESSRRNTKRQGENHSSFDKQDVRKGRDKDKRHFEEIGRLKLEEEKNRKSKHSNIPKSKLAEDEKSYHGSVDNRSKSSVKHRENVVQDSNQDDKRLKGSKSEQYLSNSKSAKSSKSLGNIKDREKVRDRVGRKSIDNAKSKSSGSLSKKVSSDTKKHKKEPTVKDTVLSSSESGSDTDSERSISSLSDMSSDSETESWRDRKRGATKKTADIELEKRRRELKERNKRRESERGRNREERGDGDASRHNRYGHKDHKRDKRFSPERGGGKLSNKDYKERGKIENDFESSYKYSGKKHKPFADDNRRSKTNFEEMSSSESDSEVKKHRGVVSVVKSDKTKVSSEIPSLLKISVNKPKLDSSSKSRKSSSKAERLIIQVQKSDDESSKLETKQRKKKKKDRKSWSSDEDTDDNEGPRKQVVNVTFNEDASIEKSRKSVYDRLGIPVSKASKSRKDSETREARDSGYSKRSHDGDMVNVDKRIKLNQDGKYSSKRDKTHKTTTDDDQDSVLNQRIKKIKEKNAEILRRKQLVEQDKQIYG